MCYIIPSSLGKNRRSFKQHHPPSGLRVCTSSYVFNLSLSLSRVLEMARSWCITSFVNIVGSYGVFPSLSCCDELRFSLWDFVLSDWILAWIWEHFMYVLHMNTYGDKGVLYWFTWYMFWHSIHGFPRWHWGNLCIGVDACFRPTFSGRNLGALFEVICVGLSIMNLKLFGVILVRTLG